MGKKGLVKDLDLLQGVLDVVKTCITKELPIPRAYEDMVRVLAQNVRDEDLCGTSKIKKVAS